MMLDINAVYIVWLRELKRYARSKARILGTMLNPVVFLLGLGLGMSHFITLSGGASYLNFLVPGIVGMTLLFTGVTSGHQVIWDRQFGFLKEIMVTPNSRLSIALGRIGGGATTALLPSFLIVFIALLIGFNPVLSLASLSIFLYTILLGIVFIGAGLVIASFMNDPQAFAVASNLVTFPLFFLSGALFPVSGLPAVAQFIAEVNPLTYGVDGIRFALLGTSSISPITDLIALVVAAAVMIALGTWAMHKSDIG